MAAPRGGVIGVTMHSALDCRCYWLGERQTGDDRDDHKDRPGSLL